MEAALLFQGMVIETPLLFIMLVAGERDGQLEATKVASSGEAWGHAQPARDILRDTYFQICRCINDGCRIQDDY
jgi:hypothetical protein